MASVFLVKVLGFPNMIPVPGSTTCGGAARSHDGNHPGDFPSRDEIFNVPNRKN